MILRKKVLVVEDNELNRALLSEILSSEYQVLEAENGQVALDILKQHKDSIALILLDVRMPVMDGYTFLDKAKADDELAKPRYSHEAVCTEKPAVRAVFAGQSG